MNFSPTMPFFVLMQGCQKTLMLPKIRFVLAVYAHLNDLKIKYNFEIKLLNNCIKIKC